MFSLLQSAALDVPPTPGLEGIDGLLGSFAMLVALFMVVAAVGEQISETLRVKFPRLFAWLGIPTLKGGISLDEALAKAREFLPGKSAALAKAEALARVGSARAEALGQLVDQINSVAASIRQSAGPNQMGEIPAAQMEQLASVTNAVTEQLSEAETDRIVA